MGTTKKYWKGLDELNQNPDFVRSQQNEFEEAIPVDEFISSPAAETVASSRRDFLKFMGFSAAAATLAACETPVQKAIPYVVRPDDVTPGIANWYASTFHDGHDYCSILVKTREGRPIKIEGNKQSGISMGGTSARVQASILSLYDSERLSGPLKKRTPITWADADKAINDGLDKAVAERKEILIISSTIISPSTKAAIHEFISKYPGARHVTYDPISCSGILEANKKNFGNAVLPSYRFDKAKVIVSFAADFLTNWISPVEFSKQYAVNRKVSKEKAEMSRHIQFESILSVTGANADLRVPVKPSEIGANLVALYNKITGSSQNVSGKTSPKIDEVAKLLKENSGKSLVVCGVNDPNIQEVVNAINNALGNYGNTLDIKSHCNLRQGIDSDFVKATGAMSSGNVGAVIFYNSNPVYTSPAKLKFTDALSKVALKISFASKTDETSEKCDFTCPDHNYLESWNDHNPALGHYSLQQPAIRPLFDTDSEKHKGRGSRQAQESLLSWAGNTTDFYTFIQNNWKAMFNNVPDFVSFWNQSLHDGAIRVEGLSGKPASNSKSSAVAADSLVSPVANKQEVEKNDSSMPAIDVTSAVSSVSSIKSSNIELVLYEKTGIGNGNQNNNPWLQELPDPISKVTWDNYITMNPKDMEEKKFNVLERFDQLHDEPDTAEVTVAGIKLAALPVIPQPGQARGTIGIALGYGRTSSGKAGNNIGVNAFAAVQSGSNFSFTSAASISEKTGTYPIACTQTHHTMMGRHIVKEASLSAYKKNPAAGNHKETISVRKNNEHVKLSPPLVTLWDEHEKPGHHWGLTIDQNACIGCGACSVSCTVENNVHVVGKTEIKRSRDMHWIRIDRYYSSDMTEEKGKEEGLGTVATLRQMENPETDNPQVFFQPLMCQHCNHAPCETVCPVLATQHSAEGLNHMTYNRCVGTRYCANNCPYKVRRFNWFNYIENKNFKDVNPVQDDLGRMVMNPDVVVRSRGVMEKCSMCIQRIQEGKLNAKKELRKIKDGEIQTACAQGCPTNAIIFGDLNDPESEIAKLRKDERSYFLMEEIGAQPTVAYLTKIRNTEDQGAEKEQAH